MNNKAEISTGIMLAVFIAAIVGLALYQASISFVDTATQSVSLDKKRFTSPNNGSCMDLYGQELLSSVTLINATGGATIHANNYTVSEAVSTVDGLKRIKFCWNLLPDNNYINGLVNISYTYGPEGYIPDAGGRGIAGLILIFAGLAIAVTVLYPALKEWAGY